ncbi:MAG: site-specific integrase [Methanobrevibacter sp.]|nr:site-specific integrase [Methanobrevibacter sp.]
MKVQIAVIKLVLRTNKTLSDGTHPIMLRVSYNGMKEKATGYSCNVKYWDKKNEMVKKGYPNWVMVNAELKRQKDDAIVRRDGYIASETLYTPQMILSPSEQKQAITGDLYGLIEAYMSERVVRLKTRENYKYIKNLLEEYANHRLIVTELTPTFVRSFAKHLEGKLSDGSIKNILNGVRAICQYAVEKGIVKENAFDGWRYNRSYRTSSKLEYIHWRTLEIMKQMLMEEIIDSDGKMYSYRDDALDMIINRKSDLFARYLFMSIVLWQGLAPIDLCQIRKKDIVIKYLGDKQYYCWDGKRKKTGKPVKIRIPADSIYAQVMVRTMLMFNDDCEWLFPVLKGLNADVDDKLQRRISNTMSALSPKLKDWFKVVNDKVVQHNVENNDNIPLVPDGCTLYAARHSYAMAYMAKGGSPIALATLMGRSANNLGQYITQLTEESDLVDAVSIL